MTPVRQLSIFVVNSIIIENGTSDILLYRLIKVGACSHKNSTYTLPMPAEFSDHGAGPRI
jgi:hypothetical protein